MKLSRKIFLYSTVIAIASILLIMGFAGVSYRNYSLDNAKGMTNTELTLIKNSLELLIESVNEKVIDISIDNGTQNALRKYNDGTSSILETRSLFSDIVIENLGVTEKVVGCDIVAKDGTIIDVSPYADLNVSGLIQYGIPKENNLSLAWYGPYYLNHNNGLTSLVMVVAKDIYSLDTMVYLGKVYAYVDTDKFAEIYRSSLRYTDAQFYLVDESGDIVSASDSNLLNRSVTQVLDIPMNKRDEFLEKHSLETRIDKVLHYLSLSKLSSLDWHVISDVPMHNLQEAYQEFYRLAIFIFLIVLSSVLVTNRLVANGITKNIRSLVGVMQKIDKGERNLRAEKANSYEISILNAAFNNFMDTNDRLMGEVYMKQEELRKLEIMLIQAQIKPHFLYNVLSMISNFVKLDMKDEAISSIHSLAAFFRISLSEGNEYITIDQEVQLIKNYLILQRYRYIDVLDYRIDVEDAAKLYMIPKLLIQPIVENAIYHGIKPKLSKRSILQIQVSMRDGDICITIYDNGVGMSQEKLKEIQKRVDSDVRKPSFGIYSVQKRIQLIYGKQYGLKVESKENEYTKVTLRIGAREMVRNEESNHC